MKMCVSYTSTAGSGQLEPPTSSKKSGGEELGGEHGGQARLPRGLRGGKQAGG